MSIYFYTQNKKYGEFSNFYPSKLKISTKEIFGNTYPYDESINIETVEQGIMWCKAILMEDYTSANLIKNETVPIKCKAIGRMVKNYDDHKWKKWRPKVAYYLIKMKFYSDDKFKKILKDTGSLKLAEASPTDCIWGIGISIGNAIKGLPWRGENLLGETLMKVRQELSI